MIYFKLVKHWFSKQYKTIFNKKYRRLRFKDMRTAKVFIERPDKLIIKDLNKGKIPKRKFNDAFFHECLALEKVQKPAGEIRDNIVLALKSQLNRTVGSSPSILDIG